MENIASSLVNTQRIGDQISDCYDDFVDYRYDYDCIDNSDEEYN
jgi:hypothetical protein